MRLIEHGELKHGDRIVENWSDVQEQGATPQITVVHAIDRTRCSSRGTHVNRSACWTSPVWVL